MKISINKCLVFFVFAISLSLYSCKKDKKAGGTPPSDKYITAFSFKASGNNGILMVDAVGVIGIDTILVNLPEGTIITQLTPSILFKGKSIAPGPQEAHNYTAPVKYTVTGDDGSSKVYVVVVRLLSSAKNIISFSFKAADNAAVISTDIAGSIEKDTIKLIMPPNTALSSLVPAIIFSGATISPAINLPVNFTSPVTYTVTATDGSTKQYTVICLINIAVYFSGTDGNFYALNATTGDELWRRFLGQVLYSATVDKGLVYVVAEDGYLYALDTNTGATRWTYAVGSYHGVPTVQDGIVYEIGGGYVYEIDGVSGSLITKVYSAAVNPTVVNKKIYLPRSLNGGMAALDATSLENLWAFGGSAVCVSNPAIANGVLYVGNEDYTLVALDANTGEFKWGVPRDSDNGGGGGNPTYSNGVVSIVNYRNELIAFNAADGTLKWRATYGTGALSSPVAYNDIVYVSTSHAMYALDKLTGSVKWSLEASLYNESFTSCTYANGIVYAGNKNNYVYALDAGSGSVKWKHKADAAITSNICVVDASGTVFHSGDSGDQN